MVGETSNEGFLVIVDIVIVVVVGKRISGSVLVDGTWPTEAGSQGLRLSIFVSGGLFALARMLRCRRTVLRASDSAAALPWQPDDDVTRRY